MVTVSVDLVLGCCSEEFLALPDPRPSTAPEQGRGRQDSNSKRGNLETMDTMERGDASGARRKGIVRLLHPNQIPGPQSQLMVTKKVEAGLQDLVQPLCHTVGLGVAS